MPQASSPALTGQWLAGRAVIVTGGATGIGAAYVAALAAAGADVVAADLPAVAGDGEAVAGNASASGGGRVLFSTADVTDDGDLARLVARTQREFGGVDALVNNAAVYGALGAKRPLQELTSAEWDRVMAVNVRGTWQAIKAAVPAMSARGGGRIVNISSVVARTGAPGFAHYVASKAAVEGLTRAAARELGGLGITVNAVAPGLVSDEATRTLNDPGYIARAAQARALAREMRPGDLLGAVLWLCSPASAFVTGQTIIVDGGGVFA
ncbi:MAG TPA: SDR family oxidoreductase [Streptosporangiaceae bacterium]|nr:SDR family oxidoreductase [Streptosporangiaceae bacterium]